MARDGFDIFSPDPFGRDIIYGLSSGQESLGLQPPPQGLPVDTRPYDRMQATPRGFISGLFSDVLGGTLNMPSMPRTGVPSLDLLYANRNPLFNLMGVGDVQKTAERISYGEPLTTGQGMTLKPREETLFAGMAVAPLVGEAARLGVSGVRTGARMVGQEIADRVSTGQAILPSGFAEPRSSLFAVEPSPSMALDESSAVRQQLTAKMQALLAQKKVATSAEEVGAINQQIGELQSQFKALPAVSRVAKEVVAPEITAPVSDMGFYSAAEQAAKNLERSKGTGQAFLNDLMDAPDVKKDELAWTGLDDFLKDKPNVTKQEVQDFISQNKVDLQEVRLGEPPPYDKVRLATLENELSQLKEHPIDAPTFGEEKFNELLKLQNIRDQSTVDSLYSGAEVAIRNAQRAQAAGNKELANKYFLESEMLNTRAEALDLKGLGVPNPTKYGKYQLAGGENYREILLKLPFKEPAMPKGYEVTSMQYDDGTVRYFANTPTTTSQGFRTQEEAQAELSKTASNLKGFRENLESYQSSHFNEPNILAHMRVNDRVDADGKKMLLVEEIQSDWHQAGREKGYQRKDLTPNQIELKYIAPNVPEGQNPDNYPGYYEAFDKNTGEFIGRHSGSLNQEQAMRDAVSSANQFKAGVPDAPFKDTWYQLSLKRILKYAADNGYERVGLTTGKQQADRYKLSNEVDEINVTGRTNMATGEKSKSVALDLKSGTQYRLGVDNNGVIDNVNDADIANFKGKKLSEVVGKDIAKQIMEGSSQTIKGEGLNIGGEGMKKYYDEIYPKFLEKYGKKWDAGVGETEIKTGQRIQLFGVGKIKTGNEKVRYIDITPKMKESVGKGQPLFTAIPAGTLGLGGLEYADPFANPLAEDTTR